MHYVLLVLPMFMTRVSGADTIYSCKEAKIATITWETGGMFSGAGLSGNVNEPSKEGVVITLVVSEKRAMFKGNNGESPLELVGKDSFLERTSSGNVFLWRLVRSNQGQYLVQSKAHDIGGLYAHLWVFKCS